MSTSREYVENYMVTHPSYDLELFEIQLKPGAFGYLTDPTNTRLHNSMVKEQVYKHITGRTGSTYSQFTPFMRGDNRHYLQLKSERGVLNIGFFRARGHQEFFMNRLVESIGRIP